MFVAGKGTRFASRDGGKHARMQRCQRLQVKSMLAFKMRKYCLYWETVSLECIWSHISSSFACVGVTFCM